MAKRPAWGRLAWAGWRGRGLCSSSPYKKKSISDAVENVDAAGSIESDAIKRPQLENVWKIRKPSKRKLPSIYINLQQLEPLLKQVKRLWTRKEIKRDYAFNVNLLFCHAMSTIAFNNCLIWSHFISLLMWSHLNWFGSVWCNRSATVQSLPPALHLTLLPFARAVVPTPCPPQGQKRGYTPYYLLYV
jgi:hypothetical protein